MNDSDRRAEDKKAVVQVYMPEAVRRSLEDRARNERRSVSAQASLYIEQRLAEDVGCR